MRELAMPAADAGGTIGETAVEGIGAAGAAACRRCTDGTVRGGVSLLLARALEVDGSGGGGRLRVEAAAGTGSGAAPAPRTGDVVVLRKVCCGVLLVAEVDP
jgi:hypothetical protein